MRVCEDCGKSFPAIHARHRARACPGYSHLWAGDVRRKLFAAAEAYVEQARYVAIDQPRVLFFTVTAPGADALPWDPDVCAWRGPHRHSGTDGCRVRADLADDWNDAAWSRHGDRDSLWSQLHRAASTAAKREVGHTPALLDRVWEKQRRGVGHVHGVLGYSQYTERKAAESYLRHLARLAPRYGFGFVDRKVNVREAKASAAYLSSYFVDGKGGKLSLRESVTTETMPQSIVYVSPKQTRHSGVTMRSGRLKRHLFVKHGDLAPVLFNLGVSYERQYAGSGEWSAFVDRTLERLVQPQGP